MSELIKNYQWPLHDSGDQKQKTALVKRQVSKLLLEICIATFLLLSVAGNAVLYKHTRSLQRLSDKQIIQYDSLLSVKLLLDKELIEVKARLPAHP